VLFDPVSGTNYRVDFEINRYAPVDRIKQVCLYRTLDPTKALSTRMMDLVETVDLEADGQLDANLWQISDDFSDLSYIPFGEPLYYRIVVMREIEYADKNQQVVTDYVASEPSKILMSNLVEVTVPDAPELSYTASGSNPTLTNVSLSWDKTSHNGRYLLYKQLSSGNWEKIYEVIVRDPSVSVDLSSTSLGSGDLSVADADGNPIYHRFRVDVENTG
ncbi:MAG TPA: hypothetical protein DCR93_35950, partial [Cytophagales bacterium]|nr:hypothetical protein [Cytophagales bacterium]